MKKSTRFLTCPQAADITGLGYWTIARAVRSGALKSIKPHAKARPLIDRAELRRWCEEIGMTGVEV